MGTFSWGFDDSAAFIKVAADAALVGGEAYVPADGYIISAQVASSCDWDFDGASIYIGAAIPTGLFNVAAGGVHGKGEVTVDGMGFPTPMFYGTPATDGVLLDLKAKVFNLGISTHFINMTGATRITIAGHIQTRDSLMVRMAGGMMNEISGVRAGPMIRDPNGVTDGNQNGHGTIEIGDFLGSQILWHASVHDCFFDQGGLTSGWSPMASVSYGDHNNVKYINLTNITVKNGNPATLQDGIDHSNVSYSNLSDCIVDGMWNGFNVVGLSITLKGLQASNNGGAGLQVGDIAVAGSSSVITATAYIGINNGIRRLDVTSCNILVFAAVGFRVDLVIFENCIGYGGIGSASLYGATVLQAPGALGMTLIFFNGGFLAGATAAVSDALKIASFKGVAGYTPQAGAALTPAVPGAGISSTNTNGYRCSLIVQAGAGTCTITVNGSIVGVIPAAGLCAFEINAQGTWSWTGTAPTWKLMGLD